MADRSTVDARYGEALNVMTRVLRAGLIAHERAFDVWRPLAVASADNDLEGLLGSLPRVLSAADDTTTVLRGIPNYTVAREVAFVCDVAADLGLLVRLGVIARS